jgi:hypothetical protein
LREKVEKYVIGETYSGQQASKIKAKVDELEIKITKMVERYKCQNTTDYDSWDVTGVVGAALLAFSCGAMNRKGAVEKFSKYVLSTLAENLMPNLCRLAQARRLYLVVMFTINDSPTSTAQREIFQQISEMGQQVNTLTLRSIPEAIEELKSDMTKTQVRANLYAT